MAIADHEVDRFNNTPEYHPYYLGKAFYGPELIRLGDGVPDTLLAKFNSEHHVMYDVINFMEMDRRVQADWHAFLNKPKHPGGRPKGSKNGKAK